MNNAKANNIKFQDEYVFTKLLVNMPSENSLEDPKTAFNRSTTWRKPSFNNRSSPDRKQSSLDARINNLMIMGRDKYNTVLTMEPEKINPILGLDALRFYGSQIDLSKEDKVCALENELVRDYQIRLNENEQQRQWALREHKIIEVNFTEMSQLADSRMIEINKLKDELNKLQKKYDKDIGDWEYNHKLEMDI